MTFHKIFLLCSIIPLSLMQNDNELLITLRLRPKNVACPSVPVSLAQIKLYLTDLELRPSVPLSLAKKVDFSHDFWALSLRPSVPHAK